MGVWDDMKPWRARYKLMVQILAAVIVLSAGFIFRISALQLFGSIYKWVGLAILLLFVG